MRSSYTPDRGDIVWLQFDPRSGHEQGGRRPAVVLSPAAYNRPARLALCCPVTSAVKGYPFEVVLPDGIGIRGVILADQVRTLDWRARRAKRIGRLPSSVLDEVTGMVLALIRPEKHGRG